MKPKQYAKMECANYSDGICLGVVILNDLRQYIDTEFCAKPCVVNESRCQYFEGIVIPQKTISRNNPKKEAHEKAVFTYEKEILGADGIKYCHRCKKPFQINKGKERFCTPCKQKNKQESWRKSKRRSRCPK